MPARNILSAAAGERTDWICRIPQAVTDLCERYRFALMAAFSLLYFAGSGFEATVKPLWFDEIFTLELSKLGAAEILSALAEGLDVTPPLYNWINRVCVLLLGQTLLAIRIPGLIGCWMMALCLFMLVRKRLPALYAFIAMLCPFWLSARVYAFEARPYGLMLGISAAALLLWQCAVETQRVSRPAIAGLAVCMAVGSSIHYYFLLVLVPLMSGEAVRSFGIGRVQIPVWLAFFASLVTLPFQSSLILEALSYSGDLWSLPTWRDLPAYYLDEMGALLLPVLGLLCCAVAYLAALPGGRGASESQTCSGLRVHEVAALLGFMLVPVVAISTAVLQTGVFVFRYALIALFGPSLLIAVAAAKWDRVVPFAGTLVFLLFSFKFAAFQVTRLAPRPTVAAVPALIAEAHEQGLPIVVAGPIVYLETAYAMPQASATRLYYVADANLAKKYSGSASADRGLLVLRKDRPLNIRTWDEFASEHREFLVYSNQRSGDVSGFEWLLAKLTDDHRQVVLQRASGKEALYQVSLRSVANPLP